MARPALTGRNVLLLLLLALDLVLLNAAYAFVFYLRYRRYINPYFLEHAAQPYFVLAFVTNALYLLGGRLHRTFRLPRRFHAPDVLAAQARVLAVTAIGSIVIIFLTKGLAPGKLNFHFSRLTLVSFWLAAFLVTSWGRLLFGRLEEALFRRGLFVRRLLVVGPAAAASDIVERVRANRWFGGQVVGIAVPRGEEGVNAGAALVAGSDGGEAEVEEPILFDEMEELEGVLRACRVDEVVAALRPEATRQVLALLALCRAHRVRLRMLPDHFQMAASHFLVSEVAFLEGAHRYDILFDLYGRVDRDHALERGRIAIVGSKGIPATFGGIERHVAELASRLVRVGFVVRVYCRPYYTSVQGAYHGVELVTLPTIYTKHLDAITHTFLSTLHALFTGVDVVHYHAMGPAVLSFLPRLFGVRTAVTVHGLDWKREKWGWLASRFLRFGEYCSAMFPTRTIVISRVLEKYYAERYPRRATYIPNGLVTRRPLPPRRIANLYGLAGGDYLLFVGRLVPEKGCHLLLEAFRSLRTEKRLVIAGGSSHSDAYVESLHAAGREDPRVLFTGYVYGDTLVELYSNAYAYVHPSSLEGLSLSLLEALSFGSAVLASDIPENAEVLCDSDAPRRGLTFRTGDVADLRAKLAALLDDPRMADELRARGREFVAETYNWGRIAEATAAIYEGLIRR